MALEFHPNLPDLWHGVLFYRTKAGTKQLCIVHGLTPVEMALFSKKHESGFLSQGVSLGWGRGDY